MIGIRLPNGYGSVVKLSGKRRRPFMVRKTVGYDEKAHPIYDVIGYYPTRSDAMIALANYNADPYDVNLAKSTFAQVYEMLKEQKFPRMGKSLVYQHKASYNYCKGILDIPYANLRKFHFQRIIDNCGKGYATQNIIKNFLVTMDKFAYDMEIINKMRTANLTIVPKETQKEHVPFEDAEVQKLWQYQGEQIIDETLFMLYTGFRVSEMLNIRCEDVDLDQGIITGGMKTAAGKNRIVPIHSKIRPIVERYMSDGFLFPNERSKTAKNPEKAIMTQYLLKWEKVMQERFGFDHRTHDCRHSFRSKLDGQNKVCVDLIMGHKTGDVGERVYTHKSIEDLKKVIETLSYGK